MFCLPNLASLTTSSTEGISHPVPGTGRRSNRDTPNAPTGHSNV